MTAMISCDNVSIRYITGDFKDIGLKEYFIRRLKHEYHVTEFWADRHVTFELEPGDMLGIIGSNGAGKSTLLKAISGIMVPTEGTVQCNGKIAALLELASGFDGDLTVRENTYLRAAMLGYSRAFVDETYDSIIDFAELRGFEDRPFKQLSSGMKSRLAFSIASLVDPEVLILDEVLSVGDGAFRKKSEATLPGRIQALPLNETALMCVNDDEGIQVCLRDNKLYVFADRARTDASGLLFAVRAQDSHGYVTRETFDIASRASGRYSTSDAYVLEVNLARYVGYTELQYGEVDAAAPMAGDEFEWAWSETYARGEQVTLKRG